MSYNNNMFDIDSNLQMVIIIFILILFFLYKKKPRMIFHQNGTAKEFGSGPNKTITPVWLVALSVTLIIYLLFTVKGYDFV
tara:strand:+ start:263 stop:505 length:243 start_codon:yes stop_codon:yes gene_type:complete